MQSVWYKSASGSISEAMRVAVIVHNDVVRDTRVRKGVKTLVENGVDVSVFGIGEPVDRKVNLEGESHFELIGKGSSSQRRRRWRWIGLVRRVIGMLILAILLFVVLVGNWSQQVLEGVTAALIFAVAIGIFVAPMAARRLKGLETVLWRAINHEVYGRKLCRAVCESGRFDCVWCHDIIALRAGKLLKRRMRGVKVVWDAHEIYEDLAYAGKMQSTIQWLVILAAQDSVDEFIVINESFRDFYSKYRRLPRGRVVMNATRYSGNAVDDGRMRRAAGLSEERKILLFQGGFSPKRGIETLLGSVEKLPDEWSVVFMGWGGLESLISEKAAEVNQGRSKECARIVVIPPAPNKELASWTAGADLGIIPYEDVGLNHRYCTPNKLWEFPNAGVPFVATDLVEIGRIVREWNTGVLLPRDFNSDDVSEAVVSLTEDDLFRLREKCRQFSEKHNWERFEIEILEAFEIQR